MADPSPAPDAGVTPEPSPGSPDESTLEDAIRNALEDPAAPEPKPEPEADPEADTAPSAVEDEEPDPATAGAALESDEQLIELLRKNDVPLNKIRRFSQMVTERNAATARADQAEGRFADIEVSCRRAGMSTEQAATLLTVPLMAAEDPAKALAAVTEFRDWLATRIGETISPELRQKIEDGFLDEATAKRLAKAEADATRAQELNAEREHEQRVRELAEQQNRVSSAVNDYQRTLQETDPDYSPEKHEFVKRELMSLVAANGMPQTPEQAVKLAKEAHATVTKRLARFKPVPRETRTLAGRSAPAPAPARPSTMLEAIEQALETAE